MRGRGWPMRLVGGGSQVEEKVESKAKTALSPPWNVLVHDDPISLMSYVSMVFQKVFGYAQAKAHRLMMTVHTTGRAIVWTGEREQAELYVQKLHAYQLLATLEQAE